MLQMGQEHMNIVKTAEAEKKTDENVRTALLKKTPWFSPEEPRV